MTFLSPIMKYTMCTHLILLFIARSRTWAYILKSTWVLRPFVNVIRQTLHVCLFLARKGINWAPIPARSLLGPSLTSARWEGGHRPQDLRFPPALVFST